MQVQRSDDTEEKAVNRLRTYHANVDAVIGYYKDQLVEVRETLCMHSCNLYCGGFTASGSNNSMAATPQWLLATKFCNCYLCAQIDGTQSMDDVFASIVKAIDGASQAVPLAA